jgi:two-component system, response regulator
MPAAVPMQGITARRFRGSPFAFTVMAAAPTLCKINDLMPKSTARRGSLKRIAGAGPVVMVDDSDTDIYVARKCYENSILPNEFVPMSDPDELLAYLRRARSAEHPLPGLVLIDMDLRRVPKSSKLAEIRKEAALANVPMITMVTDADDRRALGLDSDDCVAKPMLVGDYVAFFNSLVP